MTPLAHIDQSAFPLVILTFTNIRPNADNFRTYLADLGAIYQKREPFIIVVDATRATIPALKYQRLQAQWMSENYALIEEFCLGVAFVIPNDIIRTVLKAIFALQQQPAPNEIFATLEGGMAWAKSRVIGRDVV